MDIHAPSNGRQRFHDATGTGALGDPSSTTQDKARVSYKAFYYDAADRATHGIDVGTNGGAAYTRPGTVPLGSNTVLRTGYAYDDAGRLRDVSDPRGTTTRTSYDLLGRTTQTVANHVDSGPSDADDQTTQYTHDGSGHVLTMKAVLPNGAFQTTQSVYGVGQGTGSDVASNDVLAATRYPDLTTGSPSSGQQESRTVNALGEVKTTTDRRGTVHAYTYDPLGRLTVDAATTLGSGVDGAVRRREFAFDSAGRPHTFSTYAATAGGTPTTQVLRQYNGLGQLAREYTNHSGPVNTGTTKYVGYTYAEMAGGANHSRPLTVRYPDAKVLAYGYGPSAGLNDRVGRLASLAYNNVAVEAYDYLGLGTVVRRSQAERGVDLTYVKQGAEANGDAGDQYSGLDRFGRVVDQRWIKGATTVDRFTYGYDRVGNRLWRDNLVNAAFGEVYAYDGL
ncbi:MAG TPA: RHS repeat domain-containing protein, partial [Tepidisphaeraceae bacterium]|nr:RHS repeat domain-containing protein [Tepidisphaeraceae bacterium]